MNRYNFPTDNAIDFLFSTLHTTPFHYEALKIGSRLHYPLGSYSDSNAMHFYNILTVGQFSRKLSQLLYKMQEITCVRFNKIGAMLSYKLFYRKWIAVEWKYPVSTLIKCWVDGTIDITLISMMALKRTPEAAKMELPQTLHGNRYVILMLPG